MKPISLLTLIFILTSFPFPEALSGPTNHDKADIIVFSYDRPLQLFAYLESVKLYVTGVENIFILYRTSTPCYKKAYDVVQKYFSNAIFVAQNPASAKQDFKPLLLDIVTKQSLCNYIVFAVDDIVVCQNIDFGICIKHLKDTNATGFYCRLGKNITNDYFSESEDTNTPLPPFEEIAPNILLWKFANGHPRYWNYPHSLDMTVFEKSYALSALKSLHYHAPNTLEARWQKRPPKSAIGLCYTSSKMVNIPLNLVQSEYKNNKHMHLLTTNNLLELFQNGLKMDISELANFKNDSPHADFIPSFVPIASQPFLAVPCSTPVDKQF